MYKNSNKKIETNSYACICLILSRDKGIAPLLIINILLKIVISFHFILPDYMLS